MTRDEFEKKYADSSGLTISELRQHGLSSIPCACEEADCAGWRMVSQAGELRPHAGPQGGRGQINAATGEITYGSLKGEVGPNRRASGIPTDRIERAFYLFALERMMRFYSPRA